jgi:hypothetical protein
VVIVVVVVPEVHPSGLGIASLEPISILEHRSEVADSLGLKGASQSTTTYILIVAYLVVPNPSESYIEF